MLEKQMWIKYAPDIMLEWRQLKEEGREVEPFRGQCEKIAEDSKTADCEAAAKALAGQMAIAPMRKGHPYIEPSSYEEIRKLAAGSRPVKWRERLGETQLREKITGAWIGRISGCLLGKPMECLRTPEILEVLKSTGNYPMERYADSREFPEGLAERLDQYPRAMWRKCWIDRIDGKAPVDDDTNYTVLALRLVDEYGLDFRPADVLEGWLYWMPMFSACTAERVAYRNAAMGLLPPETAVRENPYREWIGAQIRGDFFGYINPGNPGQAAEMAWRDGSVSHVKNGIYGEMFAAAMIAEAAVSEDIPHIIETGLREIPPRSRLAEGIERVLEWHRTDITSEEAFAKIHALYDEYDQHDWCHTVSNAMIVAASLLYGEKDFGKTICLAVQAGFDTDCNAATAGSVIGMLLGDNAIPKGWSTPYNRTLCTAISGYTEITVEELAEKTMSILLRGKKFHR